MTPKRKRQRQGQRQRQRHSKPASGSGSAKAQHEQLLGELELADSCCEICHCDCYSSHSGSNASGRVGHELQQLELEIRELEQLQLREASGKRQQRETSGRRKEGSQQREQRVGSGKREHRSASGSPLEPAECQARPATAAGGRRSRSAGSQSRQAKPAKRRPAGLRDCQMLQTVFGLGASLSISGTRTRSKSQEPVAGERRAPLGGGQSLCASMASLCLAPAVRAAYEQVPSHDQRILNRMAERRSELAADKEHAWLARKYWENERLERQLLKCEQLEEYKRAVQDKQFQDYLLTKARLQALAERDLAELRRLRGALDAKDAAAKQRLAALRLERDLALSQRRCEESRRLEAVNLQQEEQQLDNVLRKRDTCMRLTQRLRRADELRAQLLASQLRRLQRDNQLEQLQHEQHWRERQQEERLKREQLQLDIQRKRQQSQRFVDGRQRRHEARFRTAKISASLRELVRQSVTPESGLEQPPHGGYSHQQPQLGRLLFQLRSSEPK